VETPPATLQRVHLCANKSFSAVAFDAANDDSDGPSGLPLTAADYQSFLTYLRGVAVGRGLGVALVNAPSVLSNATFVSQFDFAVSTGCFAAGTCDAWSNFKAGGQCG
jgi:hypothetical protein